MKSKEVAAAQLLQEWRAHLTTKLEERAEYIQPLPGTLDVIQEYRARIRDLKRILRAQGQMVRDAMVDNDPTTGPEYIQRGLQGEAYQLSPVLPVDEFIRYFAGVLQRDKEFKPLSETRLGAGFVGIRETWWEIQSIALVAADALSVDGIRQTHDAYFDFLRAWRPQGFLKRIAKKNGLLCFIFGRSPSVEQMEDMEKLIAEVTTLQQRRDSNMPLDAALSVAWMIDLGRRDVFTGDRLRLVNTFPPTMSIVYPDPSYARAIMQQLDQTHPAQHPRHASPPAARPWNHTDDLAYAQQLMNCRRCVATVSVPQFINEQPSGHTLRGTGWLLAPDLLLTCWHVIAARPNAAAGRGIASADCAAQVAKSLVTFDYTRSAMGIGYRVVCIECADPELDYALLRLEDLAAQPLRQWGVLKLHPDRPLAEQAELYVIQHPFGLPQQYSSGHLLPPLAGEADFIQHTAPAAAGTSGAPVLKIGSWEVVALHRGRYVDSDQEPVHYFATTSQVVLEHIAQTRPDLFPLIQQT